MTFIKTFNGITFMQHINKIFNMLQKKKNCDFINILPLWHVPKSKWLRNDKTQFTYLSMDKQ